MGEKGETLMFRMLTGCFSSVCFLARSWESQDARPAGTQLLPLGDEAFLVHPQVENSRESLSPLKLPEFHIRARGVLWWLFLYVSGDTRRAAPSCPVFITAGGHRMAAIPITPSNHRSSCHWPELYSFRWNADAGFHFLFPCIYIHTLWGERDTTGMSSWQLFPEI